MNAHDVRHLRECERCHQLGDERSMIVFPPTALTKEEFWHGACYLDRFGITRLLDLPDAQTDKLTLGDIGVSVMKRLLNKRVDNANLMKAIDRRFEQGR